MKRENLTVAVKKTIDYACKYGQRLTISQLEQRLVSPFVWKRVKIREEIQRKNIEIVEGSGINGEAERKTELVASIFGARWIDILPIKMVAITGSVAGGNPNKQDDIDILIVTDNNQLWLTRIIVVLWMRIKKIRMRRLGREEGKDQLCLNLWLEDDYMEIPKTKRSIRSAVDMINMVVIRDKGETKIKMIKANPWVNDFLATGVNKIVGSSKADGPTETKLGRFREVLNSLAFIGQYWYMRKRITREIVNKHQAFYHPSRLG
jgi:hypothetical protein